MFLTDLIAFLKSKVAGTYYTSAFPIGSPHNCAVVALEGGQPAKDTVAYSSMRIAIRDKDADVAYARATEILEALHMTHDIMVGDHRLLLARYASPYPMFMGLDENRWSIYVISFFITVD